MALLLGAPFVLFLAGVFVTIPWFIVFSLLYRILYRRRLPIVLSKVLLSIFNIGCVYLTFYAIGGEEMLRLSNMDGFLLVTAYAFLAVLSPHIFPFGAKAITEEDSSF